MTTTNYITILAILSANLEQSIQLTGKIQQEYIDHEAKNLLLLRHDKGGMAVGLNSLVEVSKAESQCRAIASIVARSLVGHISFINSVAKTETNYETHLLTKFYHPLKNSNSERLIRNIRRSGPDINWDTSVINENEIWIMEKNAAWALECTFNEEGYGTMNFDFQVGNLKNMGRIRNILSVLLSSSFTGEFKHEQSLRQTA